MTWRCRSFLTAPSPATPKRNTPLPFDGGFDRAGKLTKDAAAIESSQRALPIGYWKGSGLAIALDLMATMLSAGNATHQIPTDPMRESGVSQFFLAIDPTTINAESSAERDAIADAILSSVHNADPIDPAKPPRYPGEQTIRLREENLRLGVPVDIDVWEDFRHQYAIEVTPQSSAEKDASKGENLKLSDQSR